jgi:putative FmdB family regulatory protein
MPVYEYECQACKYYMEVMQKITDAPLIKCPSCGKRRLKRLVSAPIFRLKGAGWYETDFKSDKEAKRNLLAAEKEETKADTKPEAKGEADVGGKEVTGKEAAAGREAAAKDAAGKDAATKDAATKDAATKDAATKDAKESPSAGATRREQPNGTSRGAESGAASGARRHTARRSGRSKPRRKARGGRR